MDERISSAAYNPFNDYDISTARGNQRLTEEWEAHAQAHASKSDFASQVRLFLFQLSILAALAAVASLFA